MPNDTVLMPDGKPFEFWDDTTAYAKVYHVARENPLASDDNPGTEDRPFATIGRAAAVLEAGQKVVVHRGIYRECVRPARGGNGPDSMIAYEAAPREDVAIRGSRVCQGPFSPSTGWNRRSSATAKVWMADLPAEWFTGYNPFIANNMSAEFTTFTSDWSKDEQLRMQLRRGMIFASGRPLTQVFRYAELWAQEGSFWVEDPGLRIHFRLWSDADPRDSAIEVTTQEQVFAPLVRQLAYIRVSGFRIEHAADCVPVPQRAALSASRGHHWIIENNTVRWANACGIDVGNESWHAAQPASDPAGHHVIRRNTVSDCGVCGIAAVGNNAGTLVDGNIVERIGGMNIERIWETGALKFHTCDTVLIRRNVFRHVRHAPGVWLDYLNKNSRVTQNVFADITCLNGAVYLEVSHQPNVIDRNLFWDIRTSGEASHHWGGAAVNVDTGEKSIVANNFFGNIPDRHAVHCHLGQAARVVGGRTGLCRQHKVLNNIFVRCPRRIFLARTDGCQSDGNLFDAANDATSFCVDTPAPSALLNLEAWQEHYGFDATSRQEKLEASFDTESLVLTLSLSGSIPACVPVPEAGAAAPTPGPFELKLGKHDYRFGGV